MSQRTDRVDELLRQTTITCAMISPERPKRLGLTGRRLLLDRNADLKGAISIVDESGRSLAQSAWTGGDDLPTSINPFDFIQSGLTFSTDLQAPSPIYIVIYDIGLSTPEQTSFYLVVASIESAEIRIVPEPSGIVACVTCSVFAAFWHLRSDKN